MRADPDVTGVVSVIGVSPLNATPNAGRLAITLKPRDQRSAHVDAIIARLKDAVAGIPGMKVYFQATQDIQISTRVSRAQYQYTLVGTDAGEVLEWAEQADAQAARRSGAERGRLRSAGRRPARQRRRRPRTGRTARRLDAEHHRHAQRRLRPAADFDHLRPGQPVSRHPGGAAALPTGPRLARPSSTSPAPAPRPERRPPSPIPRSAAPIPTPRRRPTR